jgi:hypothetical protein
MLLNAFSADCENVFGLIFVFDFALDVTSKTRFFSFKFAAVMAWRKNIASARWSQHFPVAQRHWGNQGAKC